MAEEQIKGRARVNVSDDLIRLAEVTIEKPKAGQIIWGIMEVKELFDTFTSFLCLPEGYAIIGVFFEAAFYQWVIVVESEAIPLPPPNETIPVASLTYERTEDGKVRISDIQIVKWGI